VSLQQGYGGCPVCGGFSGWVSDGEVYFVICEQHLKRWVLGRVVAADRGSVPITDPRELEQFELVPSIATINAEPAETSGALQ